MAVQARSLNIIWLRTSPGGFAGTCLTSGGKDVVVVQSRVEYRGLNGNAGPEACRQCLSLKCEEFLGALVVLYPNNSL